MSISASSAAERKALWQIHACVLLWGFTAILGKLIALPAMALVIWRVGIVAVSLAIVPSVWRELRTLGARNIALFAACATHQHRAHALRTIHSHCGRTL